MCSAALLKRYAVEYEFLQILFPLNSVETCIDIVGFLQGKLIKLLGLDDKRLTRISNELVLLSDGVNFLA